MLKTQNYYYPFCKENNCGGILQIKINNNFSIDYECSKNPEHNKKNIYFKTFERFYLKEKQIDKYCKCKEKEIKYICKECNQIYCSSCMKNDIHIKKGNNNLKKICKYCKKNNKNLAHYCSECEKKFNNLCLMINEEEEEEVEKEEEEEEEVKKEEEEEEEEEYKSQNKKKYSLENILDYVPSKHKIDNIFEKLKNYDELIDIVNNWQKTLIQKIEHLKENILNEKALLNKMILNFDKYFLDYSYYTNINYLYKYTNEIYSNLINKNTFEKKTKYLMNYLYKDLEEKNNIFNNTEIYLNLTECKSFKSFKGDIAIKKINDDYCFYYLELKGEMGLMTYDTNEYSLIKLAFYSLKKKINHFSFSVDKDNKDIYYIYACLAKEKAVKIFKVNIKEKVIEKMKEEIKGKNKGKFNLCIYAGKQKLATVDGEHEKIIKIWKKNEKENIYSNIKKINLSIYYISNLLFVSNEYLVASDEDSIIFINNNDFNIVKRLDIKHDNLIEFNKYLFYYCSEGVGLIYIKTKEVVQIIEVEYENIFVDKQSFYTFNKDNFNERKSHTFHGNYIYAYDYKITMLKYELVNDEFIQDAQYIDEDHIENEFHYENATDDFSEDFNMIIIKNRMLFWNDNNKYISSELSS